MVSLLAIECSTEIVSIALAIGDGIVERVFPDGARQSECIVQGIDQLLSEAGMVASGIDVVAVSVGPGAFTGVRLAIATAQGLALSLDRPVVPVSSLAALAAGNAPDRGEHAVLSLLDARMGEVYAGWFSVSARKVSAIGDEAVLLPDCLVRPAGVAGYTVLGGGLKSHMPVVFEALGEPLLSDSNARPRAGQVARLAWQIWPSNCVSADAVEATYLRNKVALTSAERAAVSVKR